MPLRGRVALVTGGARRIGRAIVRALAERGVHVVLHGRTPTEDGAAAVRECQAAGVRAAVVCADLAVPGAAAGLWMAAEDALGPIGLVVNNAASWARTPLAAVSVEHWRAALRVDCAAPADLARIAGLAMAARGGGAIVNITDWAVTRPHRDFLPYLVAKGGLETATRVLARELAPHVRVNAVAPGPILLPDGAPPGSAPEVVGRTLLGRLGAPEDVAAAVCFLAEADYVTGVVLPVDGGASLVGGA